MIVCANGWQGRLWPGLFWSVMRWAWWREYVGQREVAICGTAFHRVRDQWKLGNLCEAAAVALERGDEFTGRDAVMRAVAWCEQELARLPGTLPEDPREASGAWLRGWDEKRRDRRRGEKVVWSMAVGDRDHRDTGDNRDGQDRWDNRDEERDEVAV